MIKENNSENDWDSDPEGFFEKHWKSFSLPYPDQIKFKIPNLCFIKS